MIGYPVLALLCDTIIRKINPVAQASVGPLEVIAISAMGLVGGVLVSLSVKSREILSTRGCMVFKRCVAGTYGLLAGAFNAFWLGFFCTATILACLNAFFPSVPYLGREGDQADQNQFDQFRYYRDTGAWISAVMGAIFVSWLGQRVPKSNPKD